MCVSLTHLYTRPTVNDLNHFTIIINVTEPDPANGSDGNDKLWGGIFCECIRLFVCLVPLDKWGGATGGELITKVIAYS